jgi:3-oxoacyl-[acyl-carrier protein] reductase
MIKRKWGRVINIGSMWGKVGASCEVHYSASKAGLRGMTKALAKELGPSGITVNCVEPGVIETDMIETISEFADEVKKVIPMRRFGKAEEIASLVGYLMSEKASYITRQVISVNGGMF